MREKGTCYKAGNILYLHLGGGSTDIKTHQPVCLGFAHFTKCVIPQKKLNKKN